MEISDVLNNIVDRYKDRIKADGRRYLVVPLENVFSGLETESRFKDGIAMIPVKDNFDMELVAHFPSSNFEGRVQLYSGVVVERGIADAAGLDYKLYEPQEKMTLCALTTDRITRP